MYRGVVRVFDKRPQTVADLPSSPVEGFSIDLAEQPASPVEKEFARAASSLRLSIERNNEQNQLTYRKHAGVQTDEGDVLSGDLQAGYAVPKIFVRSLAEAVEQGVITYCSQIRSSQERERAMLRLLKEVANHVTAPRHLYFESFESKPVWYDYMRVNVFDCVTSNAIGTADIIPPVTKVIISNVKIPLFDSAVVTASSVPHLPQVEISLLKFSGKEDEKNRLVAQSLAVPLELFVKATNISLIQDDGQERDISYRATLVRHEVIPNSN